jgi:hypothetical protein
MKKTCKLYLNPFKDYSKQVFKIYITPKIAKIALAYSKNGFFLILVKFLKSDDENVKRRGCAILCNIAYYSSGK